MKVAEILTAAMSADRGQKGQKHDQSFEAASGEFAMLMDTETAEPDVDIVVTFDAAEIAQIPTDKAVDQTHAGDRMLLADAPLTIPATTEAVPSVPVAQPVNVPTETSLLSALGTREKAGAGQPTAQTIGTDVMASAADAAPIQILEMPENPGPVQMPNQGSAVTQIVQSVAAVSAEPLGNSGKFAGSSQSDVQTDMLSLRSDAVDAQPTPLTGAGDVALQSVSAFTNVQKTLVETAASLSNPINYGLQGQPDAGILSGTGEVSTDFVQDVRLSPTSPSQPGAVAQVSSPQKAIVHQIVVALSKPHDGAIQIRLDPPELGRITLHINAAEMGTTASVTADRPEVIDLLRRHESLLSAELKDAGFKNLTFDFSQNGTGEKQTPSEQDQMQVALAVDPGVSANTTAHPVAPERAAGSTSLDIRL